MNAIKCPRCGHLNPTGESFCLQCGNAVTNVSSSDYFSVSPEAHARSFGMNAQGATAFNSELGGKVYFWYRIYCGFMALLYLLVVGVGVMAFVVGSQTSGREAQEAMFMGVIYTVFGILFFIPFAVAPFLPRKSWNWIVGIVLIAIGMTSCCLLPATIPLLINWLKPETKAFFGRN